MKMYYSHDIITCIFYFERDIIEFSQITCKSTIHVVDLFSLPSPVTKPRMNINSANVMHEEISKYRQIVKQVCEPGLEE